MLNWWVGILIAAGSIFMALVTVVLEFVRVPPHKKRAVTPRAMALTLFFLFLACVGGSILFDYYDNGLLDNTPASAEPSASALKPDPMPSLPLMIEPSPTTDVQASAPTESGDPSVPPSTPLPETSAPSASSETPSPAPIHTPAVQKTFVLGALDDLATHPIDFHCEYRGPLDDAFQLERFPLELTLEPGYYYLKIYKDGSSQLLAQASFYVDSSVTGYAVGFRRIQPWGLSDIGDVDENCALFSWGYNPSPSANLNLTLADGAQYSAAGLEVCVRCDNFTDKIFSCTYQDAPLWFSLLPDSDYTITVYFDGFLAAEETFHLTAPQDGTSPQAFQIQLP